MKTIFKKIRFLVRLICVFFKKRFKIIFLGIILGSFFFKFSFILVKFLPKPSRIEKIGYIGKYSLDNIPIEILSKIGRGLTRISDLKKIEPDLADSWEISPDGKIYTFYFGKKKYYWHDGSEFTVEDINYNFKDAKVVKISSNILKIILEEPYSPFLTVVSSPIFKKGLVGLGEYKVAKIEKSGNFLKSLILKPFEKNKNIPTLVYRFYPNASQLKIGFKLGEVDKIEDLENLSSLAVTRNIQIATYPKYDRYLALFFRVDKPPFDEKSLRQAVAYLISKPQDKTRALGPISVLSKYYNPGIKKYDKDENKAKLLIQNLKINREETITLYTFPNFEDVARKIKEEIEKINLKIEIKITQAIPSDFNLLLAIQKIPQDPDQYALWHTGQQSNITHLSNPRIDKLLEDGRKTLGEEERRKIYFDFQRFLVEECPAVFLFYPTYYLIERK